jgi:hypothetical protein
LLDQAVEEIKLETRAELLKVDMIGQKRTSPAEHRARRERIQRLEKELEAREKHQTAVLSPESLSKIDLRAA